VDPVDDTQVVSGLTFLPAKRTDYLATGFIQDEIGLIEGRLSLTVGTKALRTNFVKRVGLEPSARLLWTPTDKQTVWAAFTHALRTPSDAEENFYLSGYNPNSAGSTPVFARFNANPNFATEQLNGYELGARRLVTTNIAFGVTGFYNHYHDLFSEDLTGPVFLESTPAPTHILLPAQFRNGLLGITKGVEANGEWRPKEFWRLRAAYSYLHMNVYKSPGSGDVGTGQGIAGSSPQHEVLVQSNFDLTAKLQLDLVYRYTGVLPGGSGIPLVPGYSTADARIGWRFNRHVDFSVAGQNLFQPSHPEYSGDPYGLVGIKRSVYAKLTWSR
jgi:iron complex outermembrane receptor protein